MNNIYIMCGPAGCGKSTWIENHRTKEDIVISRDKIRFALYQDDYFKNEDIVLKIFYQAIETITDIYADEKINIYIDATHLSNKRRKETFEKIHRLNKWNIYFVDFIIPVETCLQHNSKRRGLEKVPENVIRNMCNIFEPVSYSEFQDCDISIINVFEKNTPRIYVTSDLHFGHNKDFIYGARGFSSAQAHDEIIIKNWNLIVRDIDIVYMLGDIGLGNDTAYIANCVNQLKGEIHWIRGNHDSDNKVKYLQEHCPNIKSISYAEMLKCRKYSFYLSHYPTSVGNYDDHNKFYCLCGHTHTKNRWQDFNTMKSYHVELDAHNNYPVWIEDIIENIKSYNAPL